MEIYILQWNSLEFRFTDEWWSVYNMSDDQFTTDVLDSMPDKFLENKAFFGLKYLKNKIKKGNT